MLTSFFRKAIRVVSVFGVALSGVCFVALPAKAQTEVTSQNSSNRLFERIGQTFWDAEEQLQQRGNKFALWNPAYQSPLAKSDALYQKYFYVDKAAGKYLQIIDTENPQSWTLPPVLYLGGLAAFTIGDYANAEKYFSRLLHEYPDYKRNLYINDRDAPNPDFAQPVKPGISKLLFYCQIHQTLDSRLRGNDDVDRENDDVDSGNDDVDRENDDVNSGNDDAIVGARGGASIKSSPSGRGLGEGKDAFATFQQFNTTSIKVLLTQKELAHWLENRPHQYQRRDFYIDETYGETPDQMRATVLPKTAQLIQDGWEQLFPGALKKSGSLKMRGYLRELMQPDSPLNKIAAPRLAEVDQLVIKYYFAQTKVLLRKHQFDATRKMYSRIIEEYPNSVASRKAEEELPKVVPVAVNYYKKEGDANYHPEVKMGVPQHKASIFYKKMYLEDTRGPKADYALYYWCSALGTEGKVNEAIRRLKVFLDEFPKSKLYVKAMYLLGFYYGSLPIKKYDIAIGWMQRVIENYPNSKESPEALWHSAFYAVAQNKNQEASVYLMKLHHGYPKSFRWKYAKAWAEYYSKK